MSDSTSASDPETVPVADLGPYAIDPGTPEPITDPASSLIQPQPPLGGQTSAQAADDATDRAFRLSLMTIGGLLTLHMAQQQVTPETVASELGIQESLLYDMMTGKEPDISLRTMAKVAKRLGANFTFGIRGVDNRDSSKAA